MSRANSNGQVSCSGVDDVLAYDRCPPALRKALREAPNTISAMMASITYRQTAGRYGEAEATDMLVDAVNGMADRYMADSPRFWAQEMAEVRRRLRQMAA